MIGHIIKDMIEYNGKDIRRINHALKVYSFAKTIGECENILKEEIEVLEISAVLHDIGIHEAEKKYGSPAGKYQEELGPDIAKKILAKNNVSEEIIKMVCFLVGNHHSYKVDGGITLQILFEADFIVNASEGEFESSSIESLIKKIFKTKTGIGIIQSMNM